MKILIPVICFGKSGGDRVLSKMADELLMLGHHVEFLCPDGSNAPYFPTLAAVSYIDYKGNLSPDERPIKPKENFFTIQKKLTRALKKTQANSFDIILANHSLTIFPVLRSGFSKKTLYYVQAYEPDYYDTIGGVKNKLLSFLSASTYQKNIYKVVNAGIYQNYKKLKATRVLYPGIDSALFHPSAEQANTSEKKSIVIGTVGRLEKYKGTTYVIDAFILIKQKYPDAQLHVAFGNKSDYAGIDGVTCFQPGGDKALGNFYRSLDYYFCAGYLQLGAFHYPLAEAMSCGIPVVTTQYYPANDTNAWLITPCDSASIFKEFENAYLNPVLKEKKAQQGIADTQQFDWKEVGSKLDTFITELKSLHT